MSHPYQIARVCKAPRFGDAGLLLAACGPKIISVSLQDGTIVSEWPGKVEDAPKDDEGLPENEGPPGKKRKVEKPGAALPTVIKLVLSPDNLHAVAVTGDDKCIRVFEIAENGSLNELSQRCMPKRPCAILVTPDNQTILCGDKFGDVYSLPLLPTQSTEDVEKQNEVKPSEPAPARPYAPTASNLTVHTGRNRRALENQLKQKDLQAKSKEPLKFEHQLLLGHVSMLTDVQYATQVVDGRARNFILTSDRDEHIRISRAAPQSYVIERYCLGHTEFISKMCLLPDSNILISGGGDDWLGVWDWVTGDLLEKCDLKSAVHEVSGTSKDEAGNDADRHVAVSGLWAVRDAENGQSIILAASEKVPALFVISASTLGSGKSQAKAIQLPGNPLDVTMSGSTVIVSLHTAEAPRLQAYQLRVSNSQPQMVADEAFDNGLREVNSLVSDAAVSDDVLYGIENMRKRGNEEGQDM